MERDEWGRLGGGLTDESSYYLERLRELEATHGATSAFVIPNAHCPVCGAPVFFYQNLWGSRVFFDELGSPWPKHPCTDSTAKNVQSETSAQRISPVTRSLDEISHIQALQRFIRRDPQQDFFVRYGLSQWDAFKVAARVRGSKEVLMVLDPLTPDKKRLFLAVPKTPAKLLESGSVAFYFRDWLTFFDVQMMAPVEVEVRRLRGASGFADSLILDQQGGSRKS